ncbi:MAG: hypothetical protein ABI778_12495, partial [Ignavibacteriota bacterium]
IRKHRSWINSASVQPATYFPESEDSANAKRLAGRMIAQRRSRGGEQLYRTRSDTSSIVQNTKWT